MYLFCTADVKFADVDAQRSFRVSILSRGGGESGVLYGGAEQWREALPAYRRVADQDCPELPLRARQGESDGAATEIASAARPKGQQSCSHLDRVAGALPVTMWTNPSLNYNASQ